MKTECNTKALEFHPHNRRNVVGQFNGGAITSDAGGLLLREVEQRAKIIGQFSECFTDHRSPILTEHSVKELLAQRIYALTLGYEDLNDHDELRHDPLLALVVGKADIEGKQRFRRRDQGKALAGKSTLNRLELGRPGTVPAKSSYQKIIIDPARIGRFFVDLFIQAHDEPPAEIILDLDATDDPLHGKQEGRFFHGYYQSYCYLPLYVFCGEFLLGAKLRQSNNDASAGAVGELARIVDGIRQQWPGVRITIRADSGFCREAMMAWCEGHDVDYILGMAKNGRLTEMISAELAAAEAAYQETQAPARVFAEFLYQTRASWSRARRIIAKAEHLSKGSNPRFIVTSLQGDPRALYEELYCARGDMENRIKEQQLYLFADRTSTAKLASNQIRLWFSSAAYLLMQRLRRVALRGTELAKAQCQTIRVKLLKIGAHIRISVRRIRLSFSEAYPYAKIFRQALENLRRWRPLRC